MAKQPSKQPEEVEIGSGQSGAPPATNPTDVLEAGKVRRTRTERARLMRNPNANQAGNDRGSADQAQGSQTGSDIDPVPEK